MNKPLLRHMQAVLRRPLPPKVGFDLHLWHGTLAQMRVASVHSAPVEGDPECGTVCCAIGLAMEDETFQVLGLKKAKAKPVVWSETTTTFMPAYEDDEGLSAVAKLFDISYNTAMSIFFPGSYRGRATRQDVISRIEDLING